jgi:hypothetical protein
MPSESTPGPWVASPGAHGAQWKVCYSSDFGGVIGEVYAGSGQPVEANARLVAAAPDLLAACRAALADLYDDANMAQHNRAQRQVGEQLRAAVARAEGKEARDAK